MKELLSKLGINYTGYWGKEDSYIIDLPDSDAFGKVYSKLEQTNLLEPMEDNDLISSQNVSVLYTDDEYLFNLIMNLEQESYQLIITKI